LKSEIVATKRASASSRGRNDWSRKMSCACAVKLYVGPASRATVQAASAG
jgi:hypothetical protein